MNENESSNFLIITWAFLLFLLWIVTRQNRKLNAISIMFLQKPKNALVFGEVAPPFSAQTLSGEVVNQDSFLGHAAVFVFVHPSCVSCRKKLAELEAIQETLQKINIQLRLVSLSSQLETMNMATREQITIPVLLASDKDSMLLTHYNPARITPFFVFLNEQRKVLSQNTLESADWENLVNKWLQIAKERPAR